MMPVLLCSRVGNDLRAAGTAHSEQLLRTRLVLFSTAKANTK